MRTAPSALLVPPRTSAMRGSVPSHSRAAVTAASSPSRSMRSSAVARRERSMSWMLPERSTRPRSMIATPVHISPSSGRMWLLTRIVLPIDSQLSQDLAHLDPRARVETGCGLVEDEQRRIVDERVRQAEPLPHSARHALDVAVAPVGQPHDLEQLADHRRAAVRRHAVAAGEEVEVLPDAQVVVDPVEVGHVADAATDLDRIGVDRDAGHIRLARRLAPAAWPGSASSSSCRRRSAPPARRSRRDRRRGRRRRRPPGRRSA